MKTALMNGPIHLLVLLSLSLAFIRAEITEDQLGPFRRPDHDQAKSFVADEAKGVVGEIAAMATFDKWKTFEDDKVKFLYPDHAAITVEVKRKDPVPVDGDRVSDVDTSFSRAYRIAAGGETLLVLMLKEADWLDDGVCFCGEVVYERYLVRDGNFYHFSFLADGVLKKMQLLGDGERIMLFEWTHLPLHPAVYRRIARSVEFKKKGPWTEAACRKRVQEQYDLTHSIGWLDEGSSLEEVEKVLGKSTRAGDDGVHVWGYPKKEGGYQWTEKISLPLSNGKLQVFDADYYDSAWNDRQAIKGGVPWMMAQAAPYEEPPVRGKKAVPMPEPLKAELLAMFLEKAREAKADFNQLCKVMQILVQQGVRDEKALDIVRERFAADADHYAAWVLHEASTPADVTLFVDQIRKLYRESKENPEREMGLSDLHNWLSFIPDDDARYPDLLREGLGMANADVRDDVYYFLSNAPLPEKERADWIHAGLKDSYASVRYWSADCFDVKDTSHLDWELLRKAAAAEQDENTLKKMKEVLEKHAAGQAK